jgi:hypothetical protein
MKSKSIKYALITGLSIFATGIMTVQAQDHYITFSVDESTNIANGSLVPGTDFVYVRGTFDGWATPGNQLFEVGNTGVFTNTFDDTNSQDLSDGNVNFIYYDTVNGGEHGGDYQNRMAYLPANNASEVLPTPYYDDNGPPSTSMVKFQVDMSEEIQLGNFNPGAGQSVVVAGSFNGWSDTAGSQWVLTNDPHILVTNNNFPVQYPNGFVESNVWTVTAPITANDDTANGDSPTNCAQEFKFVEMPQGGWDQPNYPNEDPDSGNRFFAAYTQTLPLVNFNDAPYSPICQANVAVDMSAVLLDDPDFVPGTVQLWGTFNGWATNIDLVNNPSSPYPNLYTATVPMPTGLPIILQYRYTNSIIDGWVYDYTANYLPNANNNNYRRTINLPIGAATTNLPPVYFNDVAPNDLLPTATAVTFTVNMNGAVDENGYAFEVGIDSVYVNGNFADYNSQFEALYPWSTGPLGPPAPDSTYELTEQGSSGIYSTTIDLPAGSDAGLFYNYGIDTWYAGGPTQDESANFHFRVVRSTGFNPYVLPTDTFSTNTPYQEPWLGIPNNSYSGSMEGLGSPAGGDLTVGTPAAGKVPVSWLGRPGAHLQAAASVAGPWQDLWLTDGTNWTSGYNNPTNGFVSVTNELDSGNAYFRLDLPYAP